jgi:hypothetical protein
MITAGGINSNGKAAGALVLDVDPNALIKAGSIGPLDDIPPLSAHIQTE